MHGWQSSRSVRRRWRCQRLQCTVGESCIPNNILLGRTVATSGGHASSTSGSDVAISEILLLVAKHYFQLQPSGVHIQRRIVFTVAMHIVLPIHCTTSFFCRRLDSPGLRVLYRNSICPSSISTVRAHNNSSVVHLLLRQVLACDHRIFVREQGSPLFSTKKCSARHISELCACLCSRPYRDQQQPVH